ncbi:hypothetical protein F3Y22_tig00110828pilonHSYRG00213 [Hibiscus syriacus]|uniref:Uncharacterized protein n=1 Tax=Hibiscus syriacus TaxID=106335 RepID=A0A6A2ZPR6_HIBSY|nr:hypothetical protein F3Y22_tig00110828pilonHSYRG00213 [Hibiscus syriacus]
MRSRASKLLSNVAGYDAVVTGNLLDRGYTIVVGTWTVFKRPWVELPKASETWRDSWCSSEIYLMEQGIASVAGRNWNTIVVELPTWRDSWCSSGNCWNRRVKLQRGRAAVILKMVITAAPLCSLLWNRNGAKTKDTIFSLNCSNF